MALSNKALALLNQIYDHHKYGDEDLVKEDPDTALEYVLEEIVGQLTDPDGDSSPLYMVTDDAVGELRSDRAERLEAEQEATEAKKSRTPRKSRKTTSAS